VITFVESADLHDTCAFGKTTAGGFALYVTVPPVIVILFPLPDLSLHAVTEVVPVIVDASAASSHRTHPGIVGAPSLEVKVEII
jgi:hypothetical protein